MGEEYKSKRNIFQNIGLFITAIASLATMASIWYQLRSQRPEITVAITDLQNLTSPPKVSQLTAKYTFAQKPVADLWQVKIALINSGAIEPCISNVLSAA